VEPARKKDFRRPEPFTFAKAPVRGAMPLPNTPPRPEHQDRPVHPMMDKSGWSGLCGAAGCCCHKNSILEDSILEDNILAS